MARQPRHNVYLRGKTYWIHFTPVKGKKQLHKSLGIRSPDFNAALAKAKRIKSRPHLVGIGTWEKDLEEYLAVKKGDRKMVRFTEAATRQVVKMFFSAVEKQSGVKIKTPADISKLQAQEFFNQLKIKDSTKVTYRARLRAFFGYLEKEGKVDENFFRSLAGIHRPKPHSIARQSFLQRQEINNVISKCKDKNLKFVLYAGFQAGMRKNEIIMSRPDWFIEVGGNVVEAIHIPYFQETYDPRKKRTYFFETKNKKERLVPLSPQFAKFLETEFPFKEEQRFCLNKGKASKGFYRYDFYEPLKEFFKVSGVGHLTPHSMRHSFASACLKAGIPIAEVAVWCGNTVRVLEIHYSHSIPTSGELDGVF